MKPMPETERFVTFQCKAGAAKSTHVAAPVGADVRSPTTTTRVVLVALGVPVDGEVGEGEEVLTGLLLTVGVADEGKASVGRGSGRADEVEGRPSMIARTLRPMASATSTSSPRYCTLLEG